MLWFIQRPTLSLPVIALALGLALEARAQSSPCEPSTECCPTPCRTGGAALPSTQECLADSCACARRVRCFIDENRGRTDWPFWPGGELHLNVGPQHPRYLEVRVNPESADAAHQQLDTSSPADLPSGTVIVKSNYTPDPNHLGAPDLVDPFITVMLKLEGYCPDDPGAGQRCKGGEWFWTGYKSDRFHLHGKPSFCINCHGAVAHGDWAWRTFVQRRFGGEGSDVR